ncbi:unnamed protein product [Prorocentrum cordatum]|uniref:H(+)-exporting diphosphatase n=1 Tax=Prorocentrum cordatum TaxID=2364126 RepID=A0ABN9TN06_9DINO|nr:unnamed protein product [Polarella glacialis]
MGFELPLSVGSIALFVFVFGLGLVPVFWVQAAVSALEALVVWAIVQRSDWDALAREAQERQGQPARAEDEAAEERRPPGACSEISLQEAPAAGAGAGPAAAGSAKGSDSTCDPEPFSSPWPSTAEAA